MKRIKIVGGGLTGILAAFQAHRMGARRIELHERFDQLGGVALPQIRNDREMREGCIYFGPQGDPIRSLLESHGMAFVEFDNRFGSVSPSANGPIYIDDFGGPALESTEIKLRSMSGVSLADRLACYPECMAAPLRRYARWHLGCDPSDMHESAVTPLAINRVFPLEADVAALAEAKRTDPWANELLAIPRSHWNYTSNAQASLPAGGFAAMLRQCRNALLAIGVTINESHLLTPRQALADHSPGDVLVWAASPTPLFKAAGIPTPGSLPKRFATYIFDAQWSGVLPFYVQNFTAEGSCFRIYLYETAGKVQLTAECVVEDETSVLPSEISRMIDGFDGRLVLGDLLYSSVKPRWIYHSIDTIDRLGRLREVLAARMGTSFVPGAWEAYEKGVKFAEVGSALATALNSPVASAA